MPFLLPPQLEKNSASTCLHHVKILNILEGQKYLSHTAKIHSSSVSKKFANSLYVCTCTNLHFLLHIIQSKLCTRTHRDPTSTKICSKIYCGCLKPWIEVNPIHIFKYVKTGVIQGARQRLPPVSYYKQKAREDSLPHSKDISFELMK